MLRAFHIGRFAVSFLVVLAGCLLMIYDWINHKLNYTEVAARVERVEVLCAPAGAPASEATYCQGMPAKVKGKKVVAHEAVRLRYTSPADSTEHSGIVYLKPGQKSSQRKSLQAGDEIKILAHDDKPLVIKTL